MNSEVCYRQTLDQTQKTHKILRCTTIDCSKDQGHVDHLWPPDIRSSFAVP